MTRWAKSSPNEKILIVILVLLTFFAVGTGVYENLTGKTLSQAWSTALILGALATIVGALLGVPSIRSDVKYLRDVADVRVQRLPNVKDFYENLNAAVDRATATLDLTHIRDSAPADFGPAATSFFAKLIDWSSIEGRSIRRIISVRSPAMYEWARQLVEETKDIPQFDVRVVDWSTKAPAINMAIVDGKAIYLALTGATTERTRGLAMEDETAVQYFADYYENLWHASTPLQEWLDGNSWEG